MPSLFSRQRTTSTPGLAPSQVSVNLVGGTDEFGRTAAIPPPIPRKDSRYATVSPIGGKGKKKDKGGGGGGGSGVVDEQESYESSLRLDDAGFYPFTSLPPVLSASGSSSVEDVSYGHLAHKREIVLSLFQASLLADDIAYELSQRGLQVPFLFSSLAIDLNPAAVKRLIDSFLATCLTGGSRETWVEDKKFAGVHELGMVMRWGLARVMRRGERRGLIEFETYLGWRDEEEAHGYPPTHITQFFNALHPSLVQPISTIFNLLSLLVSHAHTSGLTPSLLASLFGPLLFGLSVSSPQLEDSSSSALHSSNSDPSLGPSSGASFHRVHETYLGNSNAFEHLLLAYIRFRQASIPGGIPPRMANWIKGYPRMVVSSDNALRHGIEGRRKTREDLFKPRKGAKMIRCLAIRRNVRVYSSDLVRSCASWSAKSNGQNALVHSREWSRIAPYAIPVTSSPVSSDLSKLEPRYSDTYRKRMNLISNFYPISTPFVVSTTTAATAAASKYASPSSSRHLTPSPSLTLGRSQTPHSHSTTSLSTSVSAIDENEELRFNSLVDLRWAAFENIGFDGDSSTLNKRLALDLNESARKTLPPQRESLSWADFSETGFLRDPLASSTVARGAPSPPRSGTMKAGQWSLEGALQFDNILVEGVRENEKVVEDMGKKLKKSSKNLPPFGWDTSPVTSEELIEEGFLACFCDLIYGGGIGWMDRGERFLRSASWGLVEFKSIPNGGSSPNSPTGTVNRTYAANVISTPSSNPPDPRTGSTLLLFEEFVPAEYRVLLTNPKQKSRFPIPLPLASTLSKSKSKNKWKQAATLNGVPYVLGQVPTTSSATLLGEKGKREREREFEGLLEQAKSVPGMTLRIAADGTRSERGGERGTPLENIAGVGAAPHHISMRSSTMSRQVGGGTGTTRKGVTGPLYTGIDNPEGEDAYPRAMERAPTFPLSVDSSVARIEGMEQSPSEMTPTARKSRFRLGMGRRNTIRGFGRSGQGLTMDDLETIDFETRTTASFNSDDDEPTPPGTGTEHSKHERTRSKDDSWVDILVQSGSGKIEGRDSVLSNAQRRRTADPELMKSTAATMDLGVGGRGAERRQAGVFEYDHSHDPTPSSVDDEDDEEGEGTSSRVDLDDDDIQEVDYAPPKAKASIFQRSRSPRSHEPEDTGDVSSEDETVRRFPSVPSGTRKLQERLGQHLDTDSRPFPTTPTPSRKGLGGVSALIEKYASLSTNSPGSGSPSPSRLPVRSSSVSKELPAPGTSSNSGVKDAPLPPSPVVDSDSTTTHDSSHPPPDELSPQLQSTNVDRALTPSPVTTPGRYVHGAPLHNLLEEEEE